MSPINIMPPEKQDRFAILVIGDEILRGEVRDSLSLHLIDFFRSIHLQIDRLIFMPDCLESVAEEIKSLRRRCSGLVLTGGIGPTHDDITRQAISQATGLPLCRHRQAEEMLREGFGDKLRDADLRMADLPMAAELVIGPRTRTYGFWVAGILALPGIPEFAVDILTEFRHLIPHGKPQEQLEIQVDATEGTLAPILDNCLEKFPHLTIGSYPIHQDGRYRVRLVLRSRQRDMLPEVVAEIRAALDR